SVDVDVDGRLPFLRQGRQTTVENENIARAEDFECPPDAWRRKKPAAVIDDDRVILRNAEVSNRLSELTGAGQHVPQVGRIVCDGIDVEKDRTWNMPGKIFGLRVPLLCGQIVGAIDNGDARLAELAVQPFGRFEPAARC